jgi:lantibiotic modifying enzyme
VSCWPSSDGATLIGFAHGVAGIALALARLADATGDARYANSARRAFRFVRRHHLRPAGGWSIAVAGGRPAGGVMTGWCHGAPGVALAAIGARRLWPEAEGTVRRGVDAALRTVIGAHATQADHVCCGALARAEALVTAGCELGRADLAAAGHAVARQVADRARNRGHFRLCGPGMDYRVFDPGFFQGLSGIGYQFLRMFQPSRLPSITAFVGATEASLRYCSPWPNAVETSGHTPPVPPTGSGGATL